MSADYPTPHRNTPLRSCGKPLPKPSGAFRELHRIRADRLRLAAVDAQLRAQEDRQLLELAQKRTQQQIATTIGVTPSRVGRILSDAKTRLRRTDPAFVDATDAAIAAQKRRAHKRRGDELVAEKLGVSVAEMRALQKQGTPARVAAGVTEPTSAGPLISRQMSPAEARDYRPSGRPLTLREISDGL